MAEQLFDRAAEYDAMLQRGLRLSGEGKPFFIEGRIRSLAGRLPSGWRPARILDFGCGIGDSVRVLARVFPGACVVGVDTSERALAHARQENAGVEFAPLARLPRFEPFDLCYVNGVLHHVEPARRLETLAGIHEALRPGGFLALFENNPWSPGARMVMRRIPFDRDAVTLSPLAAARLVRRAGFRGPVSTRSLFYFPRALAGLRFLEPALAALPLGAQYCTLARK